MCPASADGEHRIRSESKNNFLNASPLIHIHQQTKSAHVELFAFGPFEKYSGRAQQTCVEATGLTKLPNTQADGFTPIISKPIDHIIR